MKKMSPQLKNMAGLHSLPIEILRHVIESIPERPFRTDLLLLSKFLCNLLMIEQVKELQLHLNQLNRWLKVIANGHVEKSSSTPQYRNLLDKVCILHIMVNKSCYEELSVDTIVGFISCCTNLRSLNIEQQYSLQPALWNIGPIISCLPLSITQIKLRRVQMEDEHIQLLADYIKRSKKLAQLILFGAGITSRGARAIAECLKWNKTLSLLSLNRNEIGADGARALAECLKQNSTLIHLDLCWDRIGNEGAFALAECMKQNSTLEYLDLRANEIGKEGGCALAISLKQNSALTHLQLGVNRIGKEGAWALAECTKQNSTLTQLDLRINAIGGEGACALAEYLKQHSYLTQLTLQENYYIGNVGANALAECLNQNSTLILSYL